MFYPMIQLACWFSASLQENSGVTFLFAVDEGSRFCLRVIYILKAPKVGSCVACDFEGIDYEDLETLWQFLRKNAPKAE